MACRLVTMPNDGMEHAGRYWIVEEISDMESHGTYNDTVYEFLDGDLCYCAETQSLYVRAGGDWREV